MERSVIIGLVVVATAIVIAPIVYVVANYYLPTALTQTFAQPDIIIATQSCAANITRKEWWVGWDYYYEDRVEGAYIYVVLANNGEVGGYAQIAFYLCGVEQFTHTIFVKAHNSVTDWAYVSYSTPIILTQSNRQKYYINYHDAEAKIISQWKA